MDEFFNSIFGFLKKNILEVVVVVFLFLIWKFNLIDDFLPLLGVIILGRLAFILWLHYIQQDFISGIEFVILEVIPPRDVLRNPRAMELFITNALYHYSNKGGGEEYWQGAVWFWFSLELVSIDGQVHFYIRTPSRIKQLIETQMYAQYPQAQVKEVEDYTLAVDEISPTSSWMGWGCEWALKRPEAFPINTYVDFGLDKDPKEEYKIDPISPVVEFFGSLGKGEQAWLQIVITPAKKRYKTAGTWFGTHNWVEQSKLTIRDLLYPYARQNKILAEGGGFNIEYRTPDFLKTGVEGIAAKTSKLGFETGIRVMYVAKKEAWSMNHRRDIRLIFRQYAKHDCNEFRRTNSTQGDAYSGIFSASPKTVMHLANRMLHEYRERGFFHLPLRHHIFNTHNVPWPLSGIFLAYKHPPTYVLNTEELATLWHFPGQILKVPTLERIESKEASPPTNLPI